MAVFGSSTSLAKMLLPPPLVLRFARQVDVETSPEADTPRPCGVALLECMLERAQSPVAAALLAQAGALQVQRCLEGW